MEARTLAAEVEMLNQELLAQQFLVELLDLGAERLVLRFQGPTLSLGQQRAGALRRRQLELRGDRFALLDDSGNLMSFWRVR